MAHTTPFGKFLRKLRVEHDQRLYEMARTLDVSAPFLSLVEHGRKAPPARLASVVVARYDLDKQQTQELETAVAASHQAITIKASAESTRIMLAELQRRAERLTEPEVARISDILQQSAA